MLIPVLENLLVMQDRDRRRRELEKELKAVPADIASVEAKIASEKAAIENSKNELKELETRKKLLETEIGSAEQKAAKYRTQQLEVRKNDEYRALGHEIETTEAVISKFEEQELVIMYSIDEARKRFAAAEKVLKENISGHEARIRLLRERDTTLSRELAEAQAELARTRSPIDEPTLRLYDRIALRNFPSVVAVRGTKCGGCHLKVSSEVESDIRAREPKLVTCDQCGRIVWFDHNE